MPSETLSPALDPAVSEPAFAPLIGARCWCGSVVSLQPFSAEYGLCVDCQTLVSTGRLPDEALAVVDDETSFYGKNYWLQHQAGDYGHPTIQQRAWLDLPERCTYWLRTLLKYRLPPARVLELGASHGGFVALLRLAGFDAVGLELSPWVVGFAQQTFGVPMLCGPVEDQTVPAESLDLIVLMDVLEHLPHPEATVAHCFRLLKPDGVLLIQTPCYREQNHEQLLDSKDPFLRMLRASEHLHLFSERSLRLLLGRQGAWEVLFEPALFPHDMFAVASRCELSVSSDQARLESLGKSLEGRVVEALCLLHERSSRLQEECDKRLLVIECLDREINRLKEGRKRHI